MLALWEAGPAWKLRVQVCLFTSFLLAEKCQLAFKKRQVEAEQGQCFSTFDGAPCINVVHKKHPEKGNEFSVLVSR